MLSMSVTKASSGATFWPPFINPNSAACLMALTVSPPAFASPITLAFEACACSRNDEKSDVLSGWRTLPSTLPQVLAEGVVGGEEEPGVEARLYGRKAGHVGLAVGVEHIVDGVGTAGLVGETDRARAVEHDD